MTDRYQKIVEQLADGVVLLDHEGRCRYVNPIGERILGRSLADATGRVFWEVAPTAITTAVREDYQRANATGERRIVRNCYAAGRWYDVLAATTDEDTVLLFRDVTDHLLAKAARHESEERFRLLVEGVKDYAIIRLDVSGRVASWNSGARRIEGYEAEEIVGQDSSIFHPPEDVQRGKPRHALETAVAAGSYAEEGWRVRKDGSRFWASVVITALRDEMGNPSGFAKVVHDDTERRRVHDAEEREGLALDSAEIGTWEYIPTTGAVVCDARCRAMSGLPADADVSFEILVARIHPADQPRVRAAVERALDPDAQGSYQVEYRTIGLRDGIERVLVAEGKVFFDEARRPTRFIGTVRDVTDARRTQEALRTTEERVRLALAAAALGTWDYALTSGRMIVDGRFRELLGVGPDAEVTLELLTAAVPAEDRPRFLELFHAGGRDVEVEVEFRAVGLRDRVERWLAAKGKLISDDGGESVRSLGVIRDITEHRRLEQVQERLTGIFAHDLRAPLSAIAMANQLLLQPHLPPARARKAADTIARSAERMSRMIMQLMDFTRARFAGGMSVERESLDLAALCRDAVTEAEAANPGRSVRSNVRGECVGMFDGGEMSRALSNLLGNALQHGLADRPVDLSVRGQDGTVTIEVHNEGTAIPPDMLAVIFDPFRRGQLDKLGAAKTKGGPGLGLGLYITKQIVEAHGGTIDVRSTKEEGTTFTVRLSRGLPPSARSSADRNVNLH